MKWLKYMIMRFLVTINLQMHKLIKDLDMYKVELEELKVQTTHLASECKKALMMFEHRANLTEGDDKPVNGFCLLRHAKHGLHVIERERQWHDVLFSCVLYYIMNFEIIAFDK